MAVNMVYYRVRKINGKYYLYKEWYDPETRKRRSLCLGNCEDLEKLVLKIKNKEVMPPRGFEPRTSRSSAGRSPRLSYGGSQLILCFLWGFKHISA